MSETIRARRSRLAGYVMAIGAAAAGGAATTAWKAALDGMEPLAFCFWLFLFSVPLSGLVAAFAGGGRRLVRIPRRGAVLLALHAGLIFVSLLTFSMALDLLDPTVTVFLSRTETIVTVALGMLLLGDRLGPLAVVGAVVALVGVVVMRLPADASAGAGQEGILSAGVIWILLSSAVLGLAEVVAKVAVRHITPARLTFLRNVILAVAFGAGAVLFATVEPPPIPVLALCALSALLGPTCARLLFLMALRRLEVSWVAILVLSAPLFTASTSAVFLGRLPRPLEWLGGAVILGGCALLVRGDVGARGRGPARGDGDSGDNLSRARPPGSP